jgi:hypothetical protein
MVLLPAWLAAACSHGSQLQPDTTVDRLGVWAPGPSATILHAEASSLHFPTFEIVIDTGAWRRIWSEAWADTATPPGLPYTDFVLSSVIVLGLGDRVGTGYSVTIDSVVSYKSGPILFATEVQPEQPCPGPPLSAPLHMVRVIDHPPPMDYRVARVRRPCPP